MKLIQTILLVLLSTGLFAQNQPKRPDQNGQFDKVTLDQMIINKGIFKGKAMEIMGTNPHKYLIPSSKAVYDFVMGATASGLTGTGETNEIAIWSADTLKGDSRFKLVVDTLRTPRIISAQLNGTIEPTLVSGLYSASKQSLFNTASPFNFMWTADEGDGDWIYTLSMSGGGLDIQEMDGGYGANPRATFLSSNSNSTLTPIPPVAGDRAGSLRFIKHKGLNTSRDIYAYGAGTSAFIVEVDTVYASGNLGFRLELGAGDNISGPLGSSTDITIDRTGDLNFRVYTSARNDAGTPTNFLSTNNVGDLRANPLSDIFLNGSTTIDFGSIPAGELLESGDITLTGVVVNKPIPVTGGATLTAGVTLFAYATAANTYRIRISNDTAAPIDPASQTFYVTQIKI